MTSPSVSGPWSSTEIKTFLDAAVIPVRLSVVSGSGWPVIVSLWFLYENRTLRCAMRGSAKVAGMLQEDTRVAFEVAGESPPYCGIRGQGIASVTADTDGVLLTRLIDRYLGAGDTQFRRWLLANADDEVAIAIQPVRMMSWDYRKRMAE